MSGPVGFSKAQEIADKLQVKGLNVPHVGIFAVGEDGHVKLTVSGSPEQWDELFTETERLREFANEVHTKLAGDTDTDRLQQASASWVTLVSTLANLALKARAVLHQEPPKGE